MWVTGKVRLFRFAFSSSASVEIQSGHLCWSGCLPAIFQGHSLPTFWLTQSLFWWPPLRNYCPWNPSSCCHAWVLLPWSLGLSSGWVVICALALHLLNQERRHVLFCAGRVLQNSSFISNSVLPLTRFIISWVSTWSFSQSCYLEPWKSNWSICVKHQWSFGADASSSWSRILCASSSVGLVKFTTYRVREFSWKNRRDTEIWNSDAVCHFCCLLWTASLCHAARFFLFAKPKIVKACLDFKGGLSSCYQGK